MLTRTRMTGTTLALVLWTVLALPVALFFGLLWLTP